jgi:hypothetical protein
MAKPRLAAIVKWAMNEDQFTRTTYGHVGFRREQRTIKSYSRCLKSIRKCCLSLLRCSPHAADAKSTAVKPRDPRCCALLGKSDIYANDVH